jgi:Tol biopolymer transport system component
MFFLASLNVLGHDIRGVLLPKEVERILSPDKKRVLLIISRAERPELWVMKVKGTEKRKLSKLKKEEGVRSAVWSPDGKLIAFVSYNLAGHSPMTTTRVWVVRYDGRGLKKITLPTPNERFSTYDPEWMTDHTLIVKAVTLAESSELKYLYSYETGKIKKINSEQKEERK